MFRRRQGSSWTDITHVRRRQGGAWVTPTTIKRRQGGTWVTVWSDYQPISVYVPPINNEQFRYNPAPSSLYMAASPYVQLTGGKAPYTYSWVRLSGHASGIVIDNPAAASPLFSATLPRDSTLYATWRVTVSDGRTSHHSDFAITFAYQTDR